MRRALAVGIAAACAGCGDVVDVAPPDDYSTWHMIETRGDAPGHGDTIRRIYVNPVARSYAGGEYPSGSILVKEIYDRNGDTAGALSYVALMRKLDAAPPGGTLHAGWLFTQSDTVGGEETYRALCWDRCHAAAPIDGAWFDYGR